MKIWRLLAVPLVALLWAAGSAGIGLAVNELRADRLPLVAPFPYEFDCPEKLDLSAPVIPPELALKAPRSATLFVDARPTDAFAAGHAPAARSIPYSFVTPFSAADAPPLKKYRHIFVYCDSPGDKLAGLVAEQLKKQGLSQVRVLRGGWAALAAALRARGALPASRPASRPTGADR